MSAVVGRDRELAAVASFLDAGDGARPVLLIEGEAGIGKTTLWRAGLDAARARGFRVLACVGAESETQLSFAAFRDLVGGVFDDVSDELPAPQRAALSVVLLREQPSGLPPTPDTVAVAFLSTLRAVCSRGPTLVAVDDVQWLDPSSATVLGYVLRRLRTEPPRVLLSRRAAAEARSIALERLGRELLQVLEVGGLTIGALGNILHAHLGVAPARPTLKRLHEVSGGNPFFALELTRALDDPARPLAPGAAFPVPGTLRELVGDRLAGLPGNTLEVLKLVSALSRPTLDLVGRVSVDGARSLDAAVDARVAVVDEAVTFSHPLFKAAVYELASSAERREIHRRLASAVSDPEERARHLALAADSPDRVVSAALEEAARQAHARGALPAATELSEQARRLTPNADAEDGHRRTILAAVYAVEAGEPARARRLLEEALAGAASGPRRAEVIAWLGALEEYDGDLHHAVELFRTSLSEAGDDPRLRAQIEDWLADSLFLMRRELRAALRHARSSVALARQVADRAREVSALAEEGLIAAVLGLPDWNVPLDRADELEREGEPVHIFVGPAHHRAVILTWLDELDEARSILRSLCDLADERGEEAALPFLLASLSTAEYLAGMWDEASSTAEEAIEIAAQTGQQPQSLRGRGMRALLLASRGEVERARAEAEATLRSAEERGVMIATIYAATAVGVLELSLGDPGAAHAALGPLVERLEAAGVREAGSMRFVFDDIEALIGLGRLDEAEALLDRTEGRARTLDRASSLAASARCRGLLELARGDPDAAVASLRTALEEHARAPNPFERARTLLVLGSEQRRARRRRDARGTLTDALSIFDRLGARVWAENARTELSRIAGRPAATGDLTPTEERIARLVAEGKTNKEVAAALVISDRTVESALTQVYRKLAVRSRTELTRKLVGAP